MKKLVVKYLVNERNKKQENGSTNHDMHSSVNCETPRMAVTSSETALM